MMAANILSLPFRRTHDVSLSQAITQYISSKYDQHPDMFTQDLQVIDKLRNEAVRAQEPHTSGITKLQAYAAQLVWIGGKFPIDIGVDFIWYPAFGYDVQRPESQNNLRFELANILYNLASMYSQLAMSSSRNTADGLKTACNYFSAAAGTLAHLKSNIIPELRSTPPEDMDTFTLESLELLMLAQAQECFWQKAVKDGLKDASIAKLAAKVCDYYADASAVGSKSDALSNEWLHHMTAKHFHFAAAAQYRAACDCLEKRRYGEEVARLKESLDCVTEALKKSKNISSNVLGDLNGLKSRVQEDLKRAEKDNDIIYLQHVPSKFELKLLDRATMVSAKVPLEISDPVSFLGDHGALGKPLFTKLVPYAVHVAASLYADRRDRLINQQIIDELESLNASIHEVLNSLDLPGSLQALEKPLGLPPGLVSHAEDIRQQDGMNRIYRSAQETEKLKNIDKTIYREGVDLLQAEAAEDDRARQKYGTDRWSRPDSRTAHPKLYEQVTQIDGYLKTAAASDGTVNDKIRENERNIRLLAGTNYDLEHYVPSTRRVTLAPPVEQAVGRLRTCLNEVTRFEARRKKKIEAIRAKAKQDDINPSLLKEAARLEREFPMQKIEAAQFEDFFEQRLEMYDGDKAAITEDDKEQQALLKRLSDANTSFNLARRGDTSTKERSSALQSLENSYAKYKEIISNLDQARRFYNDLAKIVTRFRDDAKQYAHARRQEAQQFEADIAAGMASLSLQNNSKAAALQQQRDKEAVVAAAERQPVPAAQPLAAPQPQRVAQAPSAAGIWTESMPIRFAAADGQSGETKGEGGQQGKGGAWDPSKGLRFG